MTFFNFHKVMTHLGLSVTKMGKSRVRANIPKITLLVIKVIDSQRRMCQSVCGDGKQQLFGMAFLHLENRNKSFGALTKKRLFFIYWKFIVFGENACLPKDGNLYLHHFP